MSSDIPKLKDPLIMQNNMDNSQDFSRSEISFKDLQTIDQSPFQDQENSPLTVASSNLSYPIASQFTTQLNPVTSSLSKGTGFVRRSRFDGKEAPSPFSYAGPIDGYTAKEISPRLTEGMREVSWSATNISSNIVAKSLQAVEDAQVTLDGQNSQIALELTGLKLYDLEKKLDSCLSSSKNILDLNSKVSPKVSQIMSQSVRRSKIALLQNDYEKVTRGYCSISPQKSSPYSIRTSVKMSEKFAFEELTRSIGKHECQQLLSLDNEHNKMRASLHKDSFRESNVLNNSGGKENLPSPSPTKRLSLNSQRGIASVKKPKALGRAIETQNYYLPVNPEFRISVENTSPKNRERNDSTAKEGFSDISEISTIATYPIINEKREKINKSDINLRDDDMTKNYNNDTTLPTLENVDVQRELEKSHEQKVRMNFKRDWSIETSQEHSSYESTILGKETIKKEIESFLMKFESEDKKNFARQWLKGVIENKEEKYGDSLQQSSNIDVIEAKQTPTFHGKSEVSLKDILRAEGRAVHQSNNTNVSFRRNSKVQPEVSKSIKCSKFVNQVEKNSKKLFTLRPQKSLSNKDAETFNQTNMNGVKKDKTLTQTYQSRRNQRSQGDLSQRQVELSNMKSTRSPQRNHKSENDLDKVQSQPKSETPSSQTKSNEFKRKKIEPVNKSRSNEEKVQVKENKHHVPVPNMVKSLEFLENLRKDVERSINYIDRSLQDFEDTDSLDNNSLEMRFSKDPQENIWGNVPYKEAKSNYYEGDALEDSQSPKTTDINSRTLEFLVKEANSKIMDDERIISEQDEFITDEYNSLKHIDEIH